MLADKSNPETEHLRQLFWEELFTALDELPENQRTVFVKNELEDMTLQEIADQQGEKLKQLFHANAYAVLHLRKRWKVFITILSTIKFRNMYYGGKKKKFFLFIPVIVIAGILLFGWVVMLLWNAIYHPLYMPVKSVSGRLWAYFY